MLERNNKKGKLMTLISGFSKNYCPIILGDLLISNNDSKEQLITLPTIGKISKQDFSRCSYSPCGFSQKINLLSPKLALGWAGSKIHAKTFMDELITLGVHDDPSHQAINDIYNNIVTNPNDLSIIGIYRNNSEIRIFDFNAWPTDSNSNFEYFKSAGSGYGTLLDITEINDFNLNVTSGKINKLEIGIATAVNIITALLSEELLTQSSIQNLFGAGYELVHPYKSILKKFDDLTYLFWSIEEFEINNWRLQSSPFLVSKYSYHNDILVIRAMHIKQNDNINSCKIEKDELHIVSPIYGTFNADKLIGFAPQTLNSKMICNVFLYKTVNNEVGTFAEFGKYNTESPPVIFKNEFTKNEGIDINTNFIKKVLLKFNSKFLKEGKKNSNK